MGVEGTQQLSRRQLLSAASMVGSVIALVALTGASTATARAKPNRHRGEMAAVAAVPPVVADMQLRAEQAGSVESVFLYHEPLGSIHAQLDPEATLGAGLAARANDPMEVVVIHGSFTDDQAHMPRWASAPRGTVMVFVVDPDTHFLTEVYVGDRSPNTPQAASYRRTTPATAEAARVRTQAASHHHRFTAKAATWGSKCSYGENHHCYAVAAWEMNSSEYIYGSETIQDTSEMYVPNWESLNFVDDEEWIGFPKEHWVEIGQTAGNGIDSHTLYAFWASQNGRSYVESLLPTPVSSGRQNHYLMRSAGGGYWCFWVEAIGEECRSGFENTSKDVEDGIEGADESQPTNTAYVETDWTNPKDEGFQWNFAHNGLYNETGEVSYNGLCVTPYTPWKYPGNIYYGSYGHCP